MSSTSSSTGTKVVWKFPLRAWTIFLDVPQGAQVLHVGVQRMGAVEEACVWALCDPGAPKVSRMLYAVPTGGSPRDDVEYVGTFTIENGLWFHVFDGGER